ncbi:copper homeostasis protein CutC [Escherichia coli]
MFATATVSLPPFSEDVRTVRELGFPGLVTGVLDVDGNVDMPRMEKIMVFAGPLAVTFASRL